MKNLLLATIATIGLSACAATNTSVNVNPIQGPEVTKNKSQSSDIIKCLANVTSGMDEITISVGEIKDFTGKFSNQEGYRITQGAGLMAMSALGQIPSIKLVERLDREIAEAELNLANQKLLSDRGTKGDFRPIFLGNIIGSDYYIVGGITELNYNIQSGGAEASVAGVGAGYREYRLNVAADLRLVNTKTMEVVSAISMQKQLVGYEVKAGIFKFFGSNLFDVNAGNKENEPLQLGVRAVVESSVAEFIKKLYNIDSETCK